MDLDRRAAGIVMSLHPQDLLSAMPLWSELDGATARLINHSENHTFLLDGPSGRFTLRVHRPAYQNPQTIDSELAWLAAIKRDTDVPVAEPIRGRDGKLLQSFDTGSGDARYAVLFHHIDGTEPRMEDDLVSLFETLGTYAAKLHDHTRHWQRPTGFSRQSWDAGSILDVDGLWGNWRISPGVNAANRPIIEGATSLLRRNLDVYGQWPDRYGLVHADMRLGNILVDGPRTSLIDFDDCGFCWFTYDFAASISFYETNPSVPALRAAWLESYQNVRPLDALDIASLDSMVLLRRMALLAWIGSHAETSLAQTHMQGFAEGTAMLAERYLASGPLR